ncbi:MAG: glycosyltransferase family 4 protein [Bacteroidota bacterium]|nr:glycosyltransferase family 4 protein [Bacteroidota bacterium]
MRVLHVIHRWETGGVQRHVLDLAYELRRLGVESWIAASGVAPENTAGFPHVELPLYGRRGAKSAGGFLRSVRLLRETLMREGVEILHLHSRYATLIGAYAARRLRVRRVYTAHSMFTNLGFLPWYPRDVICPGFAVSAAFSANVRNPERYRLHLIPHGVAIPSENPFAHRTPVAPPVFLFLGRHTEMKGGRTLIEAADLLRKRCPVPFRARFVGDGPERARWRKEAERRTLARIVTFHEPTSDPLSEYRSAYALVLPSLGLDALPLTLLEAMACACPVIVSDIPSLVDVIRDGENGLVFRAGDPLSLAGKMEGILIDAGKAERMAQNAFSDVRARHDLRTMANRTLDVYRAVLTAL